MDFSEMIEVKVIDTLESLSVDSYYFAQFVDINVALEQIRGAVAATRRYAPDADPLLVEQVIDTTVSDSSPPLIDLQV